MAAGAVSLRKSHDIVILSFCNIVKGQAKFKKPVTRNGEGSQTDLNYLQVVQKMHVLYLANENPISET